MDLGTMRSRVRSIIKDDDPTQYYIEDSQLNDYINFGITWVSTRVSPIKRTTLTVTNTEATLPSDFQNIRSVYADESILEVDRLDEDGPYPISGHCVLVDDSTLRIGDDDVSSIELYYDAVYDTVSADSDEIPVPTRLEEAVLYYAASRGLSQRAADEANLDQWDTKNDSGNPEHNPLLKAAKHYYDMAEQVLTSHAYIQA